MNKKTFLFAATLIFCLILSFGVAFARGGSDEKEPESAVEKAAVKEEPEEIVLKIADWQAGVQNILDSYNKFIQIFEAKHPGVTVEYTQYSYTTYNE